jgi:hypothetical protein
MGINVDRIIVVAFALGAVLAAIAGVCQGLQNNNIDFRMGFLAGLKAFTAAVSAASATSRARRRWPGAGRRRGDGDAVHPGQFGGRPWKDVWAFVLLSWSWCSAAGPARREGGGPRMIRDPHPESVVLRHAPRPGRWAWPALVCHRRLPALLELRPPDPGRPVDHFTRVAADHGDRRWPCSRSSCCWLDRVR